jgi:deoxyribonuclease-4
MINALDEAAALKMDTVQVFTKNQQQWKAPPLDPGMVKGWKARMGELGWGGRVVSHASYLINLASPDPELWKKSVDLMTVEIERCAELGIPFLVHHPGAFTTSTREEGLGKIAKAYGELFKRTKGLPVVSCLENTVGSGSNLGREFEELARLRDMIIETTGEPERVGVCFDTCHAHAGGYDLSTTAGAEGALEAFDKSVGLEWIKVLHLNDSKGAAGSRLDRHEHIGKGTIGLAGFGVVVRRPEFANVPKILETPKGEPGTKPNHDALNLRRLWSLRDEGSIKQPEQGMSRAKSAKPRSTRRK